MPPSTPSWIPPLSRALSPSGPVLVPMSPSPSRSRPTPPCRCAWPYCCRCAARCAQLAQLARCGPALYQAGTTRYTKWGNGEERGGVVVGSVARQPAVRPHRPSYGVNLAASSQPARADPGGPCHENTAGKISACCAAVRGPASAPPNTAAGFLLGFPAVAVVAAGGCGAAPDMTLPAPRCCGR